MENVCKSHTKAWLVPLIFLACGVSLYLQVFILPATPRVAIGDQSIYLHHAVRMLDGDMIYRDYDHFTLPGTDLLYMTLFKLFGVRAWIPQAMLVVLGVSMLALLCSISKTVVNGDAYLLPGLLFVTLPFSSYLDATHHWYSAVAVTTSLAVLIKDRGSARLLCAGVLLGIGTCFSQSTALLVVAFALFLLWERHQDQQTWRLLLKKEMVFLLSFATTFAVCVAYFVREVGLKQMFFYTVVFVMKYYSADSFNTWRAYLIGRPQLHVWATWVDLPAFAIIHLIVPLIYGIFLVAHARKPVPQPDPLRNRLMLVAFTGLFLFFTVASAPAYNRLYTVSAPALILVVCFLDSVRRLDRALLCVLWMTVFVVIVARPLATQLRWRQYLDLPTGHTAFLEPVVYDKCKWLVERTRPSDYFFGDQLMSFTLRLRNPARVPFLRPTDYTRPEEVVDAIQQLETRKVRFVSWYSGLDTMREIGRQPGDHLAPMRRYLSEQYHVAKVFVNGDQIWERNQ